MKEFIVKSFLFCFIFLSLLLIIEKGLSTIPNSYSLKRNCVEQNINNVELLVFGSSEANYDINPELFGINGCNLANSNQDLYLDSQILDKYINRASNLKTVVIPVSYFSLEYRIENTEESWRKFFYYRFWDLTVNPKDRLDVKNFSLIALYTPENSRKYIFKGFKVNLTDNNTNKGWLNAKSEKANIEGISGKENANRHTVYMKDNLFDQNIYVLLGMIEKLKKRNVNIVLVTLPVSLEYYQNINQEKYSKMINKVKEISKDKKVPYLNYFQDKRFSKDDFIDNADHLNGTNAERFTRILKTDLPQSYY
ncbi:hypothetical protein KW795_02205 [Candidatus Microgenomates bacterium]|nr:hypothetical protein [Candidatus Microgenomates bacterium]